MTKNTQEEYLEELQANTASNEASASETTYKFWDKDELIKALNEKVRMIGLGDDTRYVIRDDKNRPRYLRRSCAKDELAQYEFLYAEKNAKGKEKLKSASGFEVWLKSDDRLPKYERKVFNPNEGEVGPNDLNTWGGFAVKPAKGDWSLLRDHIKNDTCRGDDTHFTYLMGWMASVIQEPGKKYGVAPVLIGCKGSGKTKVPEWLSKIIGSDYTMTADKKQQWTGTFTEQLRECVFLMCEEALFAGSHEQDSSIKVLISSVNFSYEAKHQTIQGGDKNYTHLWVTSNEGWVVPATPGERRFFVLNVGEQHTKNSVYFAAIDKQMEDGGAAAMLYDLLKFDYSAIDLRNPPETDALHEQIAMGLSPRMRWIVSALSEGRFPSRTGDGVEWPDKLENDPEWLAKVMREKKRELGRDVTPEDVLRKPTDKELKDRDDDFHILKDRIFASYREFVPGYGNVPATDSAIGTFFLDCVPEAQSKKKRIPMHSSGKPHYYVPPLSEAQAEFLKAYPGVKFAAVDEAMEEESDDDKAVSPSRHGLQVVK